MSPDRVKLEHFECLAEIAEAVYEHSSTPLYGGSASKFMLGASQVLGRGTLKV